MKKTKRDSVRDKELQVKQLQTSLEKKFSGKNVRRKLFKTNRNKYNQSEANHNTTKLWK